MNIFKKKAEELVNKFRPYTDESISFNLDVQCAIKAVEYTIESFKQSYQDNYSEFDFYKQQIEILQELKSLL